MSHVQVAIVTGSNKGIGYSIVKSLCNQFDGVVYLTSRDETKGKKAAAQLKVHSNVHYHQLDVADEESVIKFRDYIKEKHDGIDILINNAGISGLFGNSYKSKKSVIDINYRGVLTVEKYLFPLLRGNARVINISSDCGHLSNIRNANWIQTLSKKDLTKNEIEEFINWYLESEKNGTFDRNDFADGGSIPAYRVSKLALCALTFIQQRELESRGISVNAMHPGLVSTDMTMSIGFLTPDEAAATPLYLALEAPQTLKGKYIWFNKDEVDWYDYDKPFYFKSSSMSKQLGKNVLSYAVKLLALPAVWVGLISLAFLVILSKFNNDFVEETDF